MRPLRPHTGVEGWPPDQQVRYHEIMSKLTEWMGEDEADAEARRRVRAEWERR